MARELRSKAEGRRIRAFFDVCTRRAFRLATFRSASRPSPASLVETFLLEVIFSDFMFYIWRNRLILVSRYRGNFTFVDRKFRKKTIFIRANIREFRRLRG